MKEAKGKLICLSEPKSPIAESYRTLRTNIQYASISKNLKSIMVTSANPEEGKSTTIMNLGIVMAQAGKKTLLIDADLRKPALHRAFGISNRIGLTNLLIHQVDEKQATFESPGLSLHIIPAGPIPPNPAELLGSDRMKELLNRFMDQYDVVLIDTPPILAVTDAQLLSSFVDGVLLVLASGQVIKENAKKAKSLLTHVGANVIGTVLNKKKMSDSSYYYYYSNS